MDDINEKRNEEEIIFVNYEERYFEYINFCLKENLFKSLYDNERVFLNNVNLRYKLQTSYYLFQMIIDKFNEKPIGFIALDNYDVNSQNIFLNIFLKSSFKNLSNVQIILDKLFDFINLYYSIRNIYMHVYEEDEKDIIFYKKFGFNKIGKIENHKYYNGKYQAVTILEFVNVNNYKKDKSEK